MSITSVNFFIFLIISVFTYWVTPKKIKWLVLLVASMVFFLCASEWQMLFYLFVSVISVYIATRLMVGRCKADRRRKGILILTILVIFGILATLKWINIFPKTINLFGSLFSVNLGLETINLIAPIGISYYTLSLCSYLVDVYRKAYSPEKNFFKVAAFACYYPALVSGPIMRFSEMSNELFIPKRFRYEYFLVGFERFIFGLMKKMVIADNLAIVVRSVYGADPATVSGGMVIVATMAYAIQVYMDFSGCMDIVMGASKMYGVGLPENFDSPFFSQNLSEFWRRWHITLGAWGKDYIMYPLLKSNGFQKIGKFCKAKFGKKAGKLVPMLLAVLILWLVIGIWHGTDYKYIFAAGVVPFVYFAIGQIFDGFFKRMVSFFHIRTENFSFRLFQSLRTFGLMCCLWFFACLPQLTAAKGFIKAFLKPTSLVDFARLPEVPWILFVMCLIVGVVDYLNYKGVNVVERFHAQGWIFRWLCLLVLIAIILIFGVYGPNYNANDFIYGGF